MHISATAARRSCARRNDLAVPDRPVVLSRPILANVVGAAALFVLLIDPRSLFDASFQLTFLSVAAIAGIGVPLLERTVAPRRQALRHFESTCVRSAPSASPGAVPPGPSSRDLAAGAHFWTIARIMLLESVRFGLAVSEVVVISALMQIVLALPMAAYFHRATMLALPANLVVVPLTEIMMPAAVAAVALATSHRCSPTHWRSLRDGHCRDYRDGSDCGPHAQFGPARRRPTDNCGAAALLTIWVGFLLARRNLKLLFAGLVAIAASALWIVAIPPTPRVRPNVLEVTAIDVGQADSTLVISPTGKTILIDAAGPLGFGHASEFDFGENVVSPYLWSRGITHLDAVVITHAHSDHIGGMHAIFNNFKPREFWLGPNTAPPVLKPIVDQARASARQ